MISAFLFLCLLSFLLTLPTDGFRTYHVVMGASTFRYHHNYLSAAGPSNVESDITIYGHPGTRSPLVNWACLELDIPFKMGKISENPHPFEQLPCLTDDDESVVVFESGAILQYLFDTYGSKSLSKANKAEISSWIYWANASFDPICFLETPQGKVYDTGLRQPNHRVDELDSILKGRDWLAGREFSMADVAVASYGLYVLLFFPEVSVAGQWPTLARYLKRAAERPAYAKAFGLDIQDKLIELIRLDLEQESVAQ